MKSKIFFALLIILSLATTLTSCDHDPCLNTNCQNGGVCDDGTCSCPAGFAGPFCGSPLVFTDYAVVPLNNNCISGYSSTFGIYASLGNNTALLSYNCTNATTGIYVEKTLAGTINGNIITFNTINPTDTTEVWITAGTAEGINPFYAEGMYFYQNVNYSLNWKKGSQTGICSGTAIAAGG